MNEPNIFLRLAADRRTKDDAAARFLQSSPMRSQLPNLAGLTDEELRRAVREQGLPLLLAAGLGRQLADQRSAPSVPVPPPFAPAETPPGIAPFMRRVRVQ